VITTLNRVDDLTVMDMPTSVLIDAVRYLENHDHPRAVDALNLLTVEADRRGAELNGLGRLLRVKRCPACTRALRSTPTAAQSRGMADREQLAALGAERIGFPFDPGGQV